MHLSARTEYSLIACRIVKIIQIGSAGVTECTEQDVFRT